MDLTPFPPPFTERAPFTPSARSGIASPVRLPGVIEVRKTLLVPYTAERMFDLIERAEDYPQFLPWCAAATILERSDDVVAAAITVDYRGVKFHFATRNPKRRPGWLAIRLERGPFRRFEGEWHLSPLGDEGCRIQFDLHYEFASTVMRTLAGAVFARIADTLVDAFVSRAEQVYVAAATPVPAPMATPMPAGAGELAPTPAEGDAAVPIGAGGIASPAGVAGVAPQPVPAISCAPPATAPAAPATEASNPIPEGATPHG